MFEKTRRVAPKLASAGKSTRTASVIAVERVATTAPVLSVAYPTQN